MNPWIRVGPIALFFLITGSMATGYLHASAQDDSTSVIFVETAAELIDALETHITNRKTTEHHIRLKPGDYAVDHPLVVPDNVILEGSGVMRYLEGLPAAFAEGTQTTIRPSTGFEGDLLTLGNGAVLSGLRLLDTSSVPGDFAQRSGNVVAVSSRSPGDSVSTRIIDCEIVNPNSFGVSANGPVGHGLVVLTRNLNGLQIRSNGDDAADLVLYAAFSDTTPDSGPEFSPGDGNVLHVQIRGASGSTGIRANRYANVAGPILEANQSIGNRLEFAGRAEEFARSNTGFDPPPPSEFFQETP
jgi:hypothetical protein